MRNEAFKAIVEKATGVPSSLLTGSTIEEIMEQARQIIEYRRAATDQGADPERGQVRKDSTRDQFAEWFNSKMSGESEGAPYEADKALAALEDVLSYPEVTDSGESGGPTGGTSARDKFVEWLSGYPS